MAQLQDTDDFLVNRSNTTQKLQAQDVMAELLDDDLMLVNREDITYKITGAEIKESLDNAVPVTIETVVVTEDEPGVSARYTNKAFTTAVNCNVKAAEPIVYGLKAKSEGNLVKQAKTSVITGLSSTTIKGGFAPVTYTGNGGTQSITNVGLSPDLVWIKSRSDSGVAHILQDTVRGAGKSLASQNTVEEMGDTGDLVGSFDPDGMPTMAEYADTLLDAIKALGFDKVHLFGHHTGASLAIEIATVDPSRVGSLMMIGPVVLTAEERQAFGGVYPQPFELKADGSHLQTMWDYVASIGGDSELDLHHREMVDTARAWQGHIKMYSKIWDQDFTALYEKITVPMFIMCAEKDILWPMFERAKEKRPDATAAVIPGSNFEPDEAPKEVASAVQGYLSSL